MELSTLVIVLAAAAQIPRPSPLLPTASAPRDSTLIEDRYGTPEPIDLWTLAAGSFHRETVVTKGRLRTLDVRGGFYEIAEENGRAVLIGVPEIAQSLSGLLGRRVEVVGLARDLFASQGTCPFFRGRRNVPQSICDDPDLPQTPDLIAGRESWPRVSITVWSVVDVTRTGLAEAEDAASALGGAPGDKVRLRGRFGGANLDGRLATPLPEAGAWSLVSEGSAVWIVGKPPRGTGFLFDPAYRGDVGKWLEVEGTLVRCAAGMCLRARRVLLAPTPKAVDP
jgi:hypothetical protein